MKVQTNVKAGVYQDNHNETLARAAQTKARQAKTQPRGLKVKTGVKAGGDQVVYVRCGNHNETLVRAAAPVRASTLTRRPPLPRNRCDTP
jgi:hypothetical protein